MMSVSWMRNFTIRNRLLGTIGVVMLFLTALGGAGLWGMSRIQGASEFATAKSVGVLDAVGQLRAEMARIRLLEKDMIIFYERPKQMLAAKAKWENSLRAAAQMTANPSEQWPEAEKALLKGIAARLQAYQSKMTPILQQLESSAYESATTANRFTERPGEEFAEAEKLLATLTEGVSSGLQASTEEQRQFAWQMKLVFACVVLIAVVMLVPTTWVNMTAICAPLMGVREDTRAIATGNLTRPIQGQGKDEMADLQRALSDMQAGLTAIVSRVRQSSETIASASGEIADGNAELSHRTEQTAKSLQLTAGALSQVLGNVQQTANAARNANTLAASASDSAQRCGAIVSQAVSSMQDIATTSKQISDITGLIDSIAFQTNILALNAAVEAARAGDQGKGFAVVASEVRALAQRSATAANDIKTLIAGSVSAVGNGVRQVEQAGNAMTGIVESVQKVNQIIAEISVAATQQSDGIVQVNQSVHDIDAMTQQNTALVEESAAAAASLREQAGMLSTVVGQFQLRDSPLLPA